MTTAPQVPANAIRLFPAGQQDFLTHNQGGYLPYAVDHGWERAFSERLDPAIPSLDESIAAGHGFCLSRARGVYAKGTQPMTVKAPGTGTQYGSEPRGLDHWQTNDDFIAAVRKRCEKVKISIGYVGGLPLSLGELPEQDLISKIDAMIRWVQDCGFSHVGLDLAAIDSQQEVTPSPSLRLAAKLTFAGVGALIEAQPRLDPSLFDWLEGRFGCIAGPEFLNDGAYLNPKSAGVCLSPWFLWLQGSLTPAQRVKLAKAHPEYVPIMEFAGF